MLDYSVAATTKKLRRPYVSTRLLFLLPIPYSGIEVWEGILNQTYLTVLNFCLERLHQVTISHDKVRSNRWCQMT